ncbi:MAG: fimbria major subunit [Muribaculaceae bacterium]|nr:fimbria major subunit [Muribaculaceae bacterium]
MKKTYLYGAVALGLLFTGCSSDNVINNGGADMTLETDNDYFVSLRISGDVPGAGTRAATDNGTPDASDFAPGGGTESEVNSAYFVFYDVDGNVIGDVTPIELDNNKWVSNTETGSVEKYYKSVVKVSVMKGEKQPSQVICYINPVNNGNLNVSLKDIQTLQLETAVKGGNIFPMSNSVYYTTSDENARTPRIAVPLEMNVNLFSTEAEAEEANANNQCAQIYVERYATKLSFNATGAEQEDFVTGQRIWDDKGQEFTDKNKITLEFIPQYWAVNAESKKTYVIKSFREESTDGGILPDNYSYTALNDIINTGLTGEDTWTWNAPSFNRSYWGMSPAYFTNKYPEVSSDLDMVGHSEPQKYISYNELKEGKKGFAANVTTPQYFKETTVGSIALASKNPAAAVASVIYVGKYKMWLNDVELDDETGFYTYLTGPVPGKSDVDDQPYIYFENQPNSVTSAVDGGESMLKRFFIQCNILYKKVGDSYEPYELDNGTGFNALTQFMEVSELTPAEKAAYDGNTETELKLQHNARTLRFTTAPGVDQNIYVLTYNGYRQVVDRVTNEDTQISLVNANIALARNVGYALSYNLGHAYFNIPVKHFGWYRKGNTNKDDAAIDWNAVRVGDFGMVRNHSYSVEVGKIVGLASGIGGDDVELVPPSFSQDYYMSYTVHILKWAVVPHQKVDL